MVVEGWLTSKDDDGVRTVPVSFPLWGDPLLEHSPGKWIAAQLFEVRAKKLPHEVFLLSKVSPNRSLPRAPDCQPT